MFTIKRFVVSTSQRARDFKSLKYAKRNLGKESGRAQIYRRTI